MDDNPESTVGAMTMSNGGRVLLSLNRDIGELLTSTNALVPSGTADLVNALSIAQLVLKNRRNKHGGQRIVIFVGSPLPCSERELVRVGKLLKRNNIAVDVVNFGEAADNHLKLDAFVKAVHKEARPCHLVDVPTGSSNDLSAILIGTPIFSLDGLPSSSASSASSAHPSGPASLEDDPELAEALRASTAGMQAPAGGEQDELRQALLLSQQQAEDDFQRALLLSQQSAAAPPPQASPAAQPPALLDDGDDDEDPEALLQAAILMSQQLEQESSSSSALPPSTPPPSSAPPSAAPLSTPVPSTPPPSSGLQDDDFGDDGVEDLDAEMLAAIQMSLGVDALPSAAPTTQPSAAPPSSSSSSSLTDDPSESLTDPSLRDAINSVLDEIEGIDKNDPAILAELNRLTGDGNHNDQNQKK